jgi:uncharacterized protein
MPEVTTSRNGRIPIREGMLSLPLSDLQKVRLMGSTCSTCGETALGSHHSVCPNCGRDTLTVLPLSNRGTVWTYTVVRHRPPGNYKGPDPFVPFGLGLVELSDGVRVLAPLDCPLEQLRIGLPVQLHVFVRPGQSDPEVVQFAFKSISPSDARSLHV